MVKQALQTFTHLPASSVQNVEHAFFDNIESNHVLKFTKVI